MWHDDKTIAEIVHEYAVVRGDLVEGYARDQLVAIIEERLARAYDEGWNAYDFYFSERYDGPDDLPNPYRASERAGAAASQ